MPSISSMLDGVLIDWICVLQKGHSNWIVLTRRLKFRRSLCRSVETVDSFGDVRKRVLIARAIAGIRKLAGITMTSEPITKSPGVIDLPKTTLQLRAGRHCI